jgi:hypothetical protein
MRINFAFTRLDGGGGVGVRKTLKDGGGKISITSDLPAVRTSFGFFHFFKAIFSHAQFEM